MLEQFFGDRAWYKHFRAWAVVVLGIVPLVATALLETGTLGPETLETVLHWSARIGGALGVLGIAREQTRARARAA